MTMSGMMIKVKKTYKAGRWWKSLAKKKSENQTDFRHGSVLRDTSASKNIVVDVCQSLDNAILVSQESSGKQKCKRENFQSWDKLTISDHASL